MTENMENVVENMSNTAENVTEVVANSDTGLEAAPGTAPAINFQNEMDYLAAREIASRLLEQELLTEEEFRQIDEMLKAEFSPVFTSLMADYPCY